MESDQEKEFAQLDRRFRPVLMAFFLRRTPSHAEAEDLTQEVFLRLAATDRGEMRSAEAYVFQVASNLLRDRARREKVRADYRKGMLAMDGAHVDTIDPLRIASDRQALAALREALQAMPERTRAIFLLCRLENVDRRTVAESYGVSISLVDRELARALAMLTAHVRSQQ